MQVLGSKMKLFKGYAAEYKKRHDELWPELEKLLRAAGVREYYIFLDEETSALYATLKADDQATLDELPSHPVMKRWWQYMKDIMETNEDGSPVVVPLKNVFSLR